MRSAFWCCVVLAVVFPVGCRRDGSKTKSAEDPGVAVAKLIVQPTGAGSEDIVGGALDDFYDRQMSILRGDELRSAIIKSAGASAEAASLKVARMPGNSVITLIGHGSTPSEAGAYINLLIDAYVKKVQGVVADEKSLQERSKSLSARKTAAEKTLREAEKKLTLFKLEHDTARADNDKAMSDAKLKRLQSARNFYESELKITEKADLETDLQRRRTAVNPPTDMPEEFQRLINSNLTPNEQAYLDSLARNDPATTKATRVNAEADQKARIESFKTQLSTVNEIARDLEKRLKTIAADEATTKKLSEAMAAAKTEYDNLRSSELQGTNVTDTKAPAGVMVTIIEKPATPEAPH